MIDLDISGGVWTLTLNRAEKANALSFEMLERIAEIASDAKAARAVIITGAGAVFSAGADLNAVKAGLATSDVWERVSGAIADLPGLTIAALNGTLAGGAFGMALACDIRIAEEQAALALPEARVGLLPCAGGTQRLTQLVGEGWAKRMILCGERIGAQQAQTLGLVEEVVATGEALVTATALAAKVGNQSPTSVAACKRLIHSARNIAIADGLVAERDEFVALFSTEDQQEGTNAFLEKREPEWKNR